MKKGALIVFMIFLMALGAGTAFAAKGGTPGPPEAAGGGGPPDDVGPGVPNEETTGNNLSFPVIWSEGVTKALRGTPGMEPQLEGEWWYWWGTDVNDAPLACPPDPDDTTLCDDGVEGQAAGPSPGGDWVKAFLQKDPYNVWQADSASWPVNVDWIDWGDNLESVDWYTRSQVRTEVVLYQDLGTPMLEYEMRHVSGWGIDEVHGLAAQGVDPAPMTGPGNQATVYTPCARLTIQKLLVDRNDPSLSNLVWIANEGWTDPEGTGLINPPIFNNAVYEGADGPGYYSAEINVKGKVIYGYTWNVRRLHDPTGGTAAGDYRITFSFDESCGTATNFVAGITEIMAPAEEAEIVILEDDGGNSPGGGAVPVLDFENNLTYIDVRILDRTGGGGGSPGGRR